MRALAAGPGAGRRAGAGNPAAPPLAAGCCWAGARAAGGGAGAVFPAAFYVVAFGLVTGGLAQIRIGKAVAP